MSLAGIPTATKHALNSSKTTTGRPSRRFLWGFQVMHGISLGLSVFGGYTVMSLNSFLTSTKQKHIPSKPTIGMSRRLMLEFRGMNFMPFSNYGRRQRLLYLWLPSVFWWSKKNSSHVTHWYSHLNQTLPHPQNTHHWHNKEIRVRVPRDAGYF